MFLTDCEMVQRSILKNPVLNYRLGVRSACNLSRIQLSTLDKTQWFGNFSTFKALFPRTHFWPWGFFGEYIATNLIRTTLVGKSLSCFPPCFDLEIQLPGITWEKLFHYGANHKVSFLLQPRCLRREAFKKKLNNVKQVIHLTPFESRLFRGHG